MKIYFDNIIYWLQRSGGGSVYWTELIKRFNQNPNINSVFIDQKESTNNIFREDLKLNVVKTESLFTLKIRRYLPFTKKLEGKSIFHSSYFRVSNSKNVINVTTIHDFTTEKFRSGLARFVNLKQKKYAIEKSKGVICISENTKKDLLHFFPHTNPNKIRVIYNGVSDDFFKIEDDFKINEINEKFHALNNFKYLLYIGHRTSYKNFDLAVKAASKLEGKYKFVVIGEKFNPTEDDLIKQYFKEGVIQLSGLKNHDLNYLYNKAFALLYPSSYEGFGIPLVEAMKTGCPVIANNNSSIPEVGGDAAILHNNLSEENIYQSCIDLENDSYRNMIISRGLIQSEKFNWDKTFLEYINYYKELYNEPNV